MIGWQQAGKVEFHTKEITQGVGVLGAREPLEGIDRALGEDVFLELLQGLRPRRSLGLRCLLRWHVARLQHRGDRLQQFAISK